MRYLLLALLVVAQAQAGRLRTLDPALGAQASASRFAATAPGRVSLPEAALAEEHLLRVVIEQADTDQLTLGATTDAQVVRLALEGAELVARSDNLVVARWPAQLANGALTLDVSAPASIAIEGKELVAAGSTEVVGVKSGPGLLSWAQQMRFGEVTAGVRTWLTRAPGAGFRPRAYSPDDARRAGYFTESPGHANVWRPDRPITVVLHAGMPDEVRAEARAAALSWNAALQAATGRALVQVEDARDPGLLPGTPDRIVVYWFAEDPGGEMAGTEGLAPSTVDPRTGEIVAAHVLLNGEVILGGDRPRDEESPLGKKPAPRRVALRLPGGALAAVRTMPVPCTAGLRHAPRRARLVRDTLVHEIGHALGLRHNFKGSADLAHLSQGQVSTSVMDYLLDLTTPDAPGAYDRAAILFGYGHQSIDVMGSLLYATDEHMGHDPDANQFDAGDPLAFYVEEMRRLRRTDDPADLRDTLQHLRYFVNRASPDRSARAFECLMQSVTRQGDGPRVTREREAARAVLAAAAPPKKDDDDEPAPYAPLTPEQQAAIDRATR